VQGSYLLHENLSEERSFIFVVSSITTYCLFCLLAKQLVDGMMKVDPAHRLTSKEILSHPWIKVFALFFSSQLMSKKSIAHWVRQGILVLAASLSKLPILLSFFYRRVSKR